MQLAAPVPGLPRSGIPAAACSKYVIAETEPLDRLVVPSSAQRNLGKLKTVKTKWPRNPVSRRWERIEGERFSGSHRKGGLASDLRMGLTLEVRPYQDLPRSRLMAHASSTKADRVTFTGNKGLLGFVSPVVYKSQSGCAPFASLRDLSRAWVDSL